MTYIKKLTFAPIFLIFFAASWFYAASLLKTPLSFLSLNLNEGITITIITALLLLSSLFYIVFTALSQDLRIILPIAAFGTLLPLIFIQAPLNYVIVAGYLISTYITSPILLNKLQGYFNFDAAALLSPSIKHLVFLLFLTLSFAYYLSANAEIQKNGFSIPDSFIDQIIKLTGSMQQNVQGVRYIAQNLSPEQIQLLKQHPELLKQYNIDPKTLDLLASPQPAQKSTSSSPISQIATNLIKDTLQNLLKPYLGIIPAILAISLLSTLMFIEWILVLFLSPLISLIFYILEKTGFTKFTTEMREVKKMIV